MTINRTLSRTERLLQLTAYFLRLGTLGFGGPAALVALMKRELVERSQWLTRDALSQPWMPRRVPTGALSLARPVLKVLLGETHATRRVLERTTPIGTRPVNRGARPINRQWIWARRHVRGVDDDVVTARSREHHRRDECPVTEVVREDSVLTLSGLFSLRSARRRWCRAAPEM